MLSKMRKKQIILLVLILLSFTLWIYKSFDKQFTNKIIPITEYKYIKNIIIEPNISCYAQNFFVIMITSYVGHVELRSAHRRAMPTELLKSMNVTRLFLLAKIPEKEKSITQEALHDESSIFGDILQGSFEESYRNLTYKHLMGLQWTSNYCRNISFILKVDDDIVFNLNKTYDLLINIRNNTNVLTGYMLNNTIPRRSKQNKWYVSSDEYPESIYPSYLSGWYYIITPELAHSITQEAQYHNLFWIDDIFITGILTKALGIKLKQLPKDYWLEYYELLECCIKDMMTKLIQCDYVVGPNGGRNDLIIEYKEALQYCKKNNCSRRTDKQILTKVCINDKERAIFGSGQAVIKSVKL